MNVTKTVLLLTALTLLFVLIGNLLGGQRGMVIALAFAAAMNFFSYWFSDKMVLAMYRAQKISEGDNPRLFRIVRNVATAARIPQPKVYVIPGPTPNAFATGRNPRNAAVAATEGILNLLSDEELEGVIAHEVAHIRNRDILIGTIAATIAGAVMYFAHMAQWAAIFGGGSSRDSDNRGNGLALLVVAVVAPLAATMIQLAISRSREYAADETGARICHRPLALANALRKLHTGNARLPMAHAKPATAHMFIVNPFSARGMMNLFSTHPPIEERIARLQVLAVQLG